MTPASIRSMIRSALRLVWRNTSRKDFLIEARYKIKNKGKFYVQCEVCDKVMGFSERDYRIKKDGTKSKKKRLVYEVDHIDGNHQFLSLNDLSAYAKTLLNGKMGIKCVKCHGEKTYG